MGRVYEGIEQADPDTVAVRSFHDDRSKETSRFEKSFKREYGDIEASCRNEYIVEGHDFQRDETSGVGLLVRSSRGEELQQLILKRERRWSNARLVRMLAQDRDRPTRRSAQPPVLPSRTQARQLFLLRDARGRRQET